MTEPAAAPPPPMRIKYDDEKHLYWLDGERVPSVTDILEKTMPKPALTWWGFRVGMYAVLELVAQGRLSWAPLVDEAPYAKQTLDAAPDPDREHRMVGKRGQPVGKARTLLEHLAVRYKLHPNAVKDLAADRGTSVHTALEALGLGQMPDLYGDASPYPEDERPYIHAVVQWWMEQEPEFVAQEVIVASRKHRYAGRFDLLVRYAARPDELVLVDLKTGKDVYPDTHFRQLQAYEIAWLEGGGEPIDRMEILNARADGTYKLAQAKVRPEHFLAQLTAYRGVESFEALQKGIEPPQLELVA